jgi:hypothetical protein
METTQIVKQITRGNIHDQNYINMNEITALDYETLIKKGGVLELFIFIYETKDDKENHRNYTKLVYSVKEFIKKGLRDKKNMSYRYKIVDKELLSEES